MTVPRVLPPNTPTPRGLVVFVPDDGREVRMLPPGLGAQEGAWITELQRQTRAPIVFPFEPLARGAAWVLVPCLIALRAEFNALAPGRDKASDGSIGDTAHAASSSDHNPDESGATPYEDSDRINEVHAIDVDKDLRKSGWTMQRAVDIIVERHRTGKDDRLQYVIWNGRIASRSWGWTWRAYSGANPHDKHAHFSARYTTVQESDTRPWGLLAADAPIAPAKPVEPKEDFPMEQGDFNKLMTGWAKSAEGRAALAVAVLSHDPGSDASGNYLPGGIPNPDPVGGKTNTTLALTTVGRDAVATRAELRDVRKTIGDIAVALARVESAVAANPQEPTVPPTAG